MKLLISIAIAAIGAVSTFRSARATEKRPLAGVFGLLLLGIGSVWTLVLVGRGLIEGIFFVAGTIAAIAALAYLGYWVVGRFIRRKKTKLISKDDRRSYLGKTGSAVTPLRPSGVAIVDGDRIEVATEGEFIASGSKIRVVAMDTRRYFVRLDD